jgi:hypothetical protein
MEQDSYEIDLEDVEGNPENSMPQYEDENPDLEEDEYDQEQNPDESKYWRH